MINTIKKSYNGPSATKNWQAIELNQSFNKTSLNFAAVGNNQTHNRALSL